MNGLSYYTRQKESWDDTETEDIKKEYNIYKMSISEIADIHRRTPGSISYKLKNLGIITHNTLSKGYEEYKNSDLYNEIVKKGKIEDAEKKAKKESTIKSSIDLSLIQKQSSDITELKNDIKSIKKDIKHILWLINAVYDFENQ